MLVRPSHYDTSGITLKFIRPRRFGPIRELDFPACRRVNLIFRRAGEFSSVPVSSRSRDGIRYPPSWGSIHGKGPFGQRKPCPLLRYSSPISSRAASLIISRLQGGSHTRSTFRSEDTTYE